MSGLGLVLSVWTVGASAAGGSVSTHGEGASTTPTDKASGTPRLAPMATRAELTIGPGHEGHFELLDAAGRQIATLDLRAARATQLDLPAGEYRLLAEDGSEQRFELRPGGRTQYRGSTLFERESAAPNPAGPPLPGPRSSVSEPLPPAARLSPGASGGASAFVPGLGQMLNRKPATGAGILLGTIALGATSLMAAQRPSDATRHDPLSEGARLGGFAVSTAAFQLLWAGQVMHAYRDARGSGVAPRRDHRLALDLTRNATVGVGASPDSLNYLRDWSLSVLGQPFERVQLGLSDLSLHRSDSAASTTLQAGVRAGYRVFERKAVWMNVGGGVIGQLGWRPNPLWRVEEQGAQARRSVEGSATFYAQYDLRIFIVDRWSLNLMPRFFLPVGTRRYQDDRAVASLSASFELGTGVGVLF